MPETRPDPAAPHGLAEGALGHLLGYQIALAFLSGWRYTSNGKPT